MNAKTLEAVKKHGENLLEIFPNSTERDPVALCKKVRRIETSLQRPLLDYCNGDCTLEAVDQAEAGALKRLGALLWGNTVPDVPVFVNRDPRGYALKIDDAWIREKGWTLNGSNRHTNGSGSIAVARLHRDMGGYGIIAPDLTN
jgi:hypothetical protein